MEIWDAIKDWPTARLQALTCDAEEMDKLLWELSLPSVDHNRGVVRMHAENQLKQRRSTRLTARRREVELIDAIHNLGPSAPGMRDHTFATSLRDLSRKLHSDAGQCNLWATEAADEGADEHAAAYLAAEERLREAQKLVAEAARIFYGS